MTEFQVLEPKIFLHDEGTQVSEQLSTSHNKIDITTSHPGMCQSQILSSCVKLFLPLHSEISH